MTVSQNSPVAIVGQYLLYVIDFMKLRNISAEGTDKLTFRHSKIDPCASKQPLLSTLRTQLSCYGDNGLLM